jgi:protein-disulfide isomerase
MKEINNFLKRVLVFFLIFTVQAESKILSIGSPDATVVIKVFSSLTCPHCANFHEVVFDKLKDEYIDKGLVRFEHHAFPLDLAALNAEVVVRCQTNNNSRFRLLGEIYKKQKFWAVGSDINKINNLIKKIGLDFDLTENKIDECLKAQKKYKIDATPTIFINEKKYSGKVDYKSFKKFIEKNL